MRKITKLLISLMVVCFVGILLASCIEEDECAKGHTWGEWENITATCTESGEQTHKCSVCGKTETSPVDKLGHDLGEYTLVYPSTCEDGGTEKRTCSRCDFFEEKTIEKLGHNFGEYTVKEPATCEDEGIEERKCTRCTASEERPIEKLGHSLEKVPSKPSTCEEHGNIEHYSCTRCEKLFEDEDGLTELDSVELPLEDHSWPDDYTSDYQYHWKVCTVCKTRSPREPHEGKKCSTCGYQSMPSLKEVMTNLALSRNYTYELDDQIFGVTTTFRYTEKAFYYHPSQEKHGGTPYGYAQSNKGEVFQYVIENGQIVPGYAERNSSGEVLTDLWNQAIISFYDFNLDAFDDVVRRDNTYEITDSVNKTLFAALAGYGDVFVAECVTVTVEVLSEDTIKTIVHFEPGNTAYTGDCIGIVKNVGSTTIPEIEEYLASGKGAKASESDNVLEFLAKVKDSKQYKVEVTTSSKHFIDVFNEKYYYSYNEMNSSDAKGYLVLDNKIYQFTIVDGKVKVSNEISYTSSDHSNLWAQGLFKNLSSINLSGLELELQEDGTLKLANNVSVMSSLFSITHDSNPFFSVNSDDYIQFEKFDGSSLTYTYYRYDGTKTTVTISELESAKNSVIESYIEDGGDLPDPSDISKLKETINSWKQSQSYTVGVAQSISFPPFGFTATGNKTIIFTKDKYFQQNLTTPANSFGFAKDENGIYKLDQDQVKGEYVEQDNLYASGLFYSFSDLDLEKMVAEQQLDGTFKITDTDTIAMLLNIAGYNGSAGASTYNTCVVTISEGLTTIKLSSAFYGSITLTITE